MGVLFYRYFKFKLNIRKSSPSNILQGELWADGDIRLQPFDDVFAKVVPQLMVVWQGLDDQSRSNGTQENPEPVPGIPGSSEHSHEIHGQADTKHGNERLANKGQQGFFDFGNVHGVLQKKEFKGLDCYYNSTFIQ